MKDTQINEEIIQAYAQTWSVLSKYDEGKFEELENPVGIPFVLSYADAVAAIQDLKKQQMHANEATSLFGREQQGGKLSAILGNIDQTFGGEPLYPSRAEKACHLLYFLIKDRPFSDGNKRIGVLLFLLYLKKQGLTLGERYRGLMDIMALQIAQSNPKDKDGMIGSLMACLLTIESLEENE